MSMHSRYAAAFFGLIALMILFGIAAVYLLYSGHYVLTAVVFALLYLGGYLFGKRFSKMFFILFLLRHLKSKDGTIPLEEFDRLLEKALGNRRSPDQRAQLREKILTTMVEEKAVAISEEAIILRHRAS